ncbi:MAG: tail fiber domain-containing protein [Vicinamibacterales bacterium]
MKARAARNLILAIVLAAVPAGVPAASAQPLGSFTWQLQPFCNRVTVNVRQDGAVYTLDGTDDQCGAAQTAPLVGLAAPNPDGSIGFGLNIISPTGQAIPVQARISVATLSGTWSDAAGNGGTFAFGANTSGSPRPNTPATGGDITGVAAGAGLTGGGTTGDVALAVDTAVIQSRVTTACPAGQALRSIAENGTAVCEPITGSAGGDITAVNAGIGLSGGGAAGDVALSVAFGADGVAPLVARADHEHLAGSSTNVAIGSSAMAAVTFGLSNTAIGVQALSSDTTGSNNTALGAGALRTNITGNLNVAVGSDALALVTVSGNTAVGHNALDAATTGAANTAAGNGALGSVTTGGFNAALGHLAAQALTTGSRVTVLGAESDVGGGGVSNATAIGANARVDASNALVLGSINGVNGASADTSVGIGTTSPGAALEIVRAGAGDQLRLTRFGLTEGARLTFRSARGTPAAPQALQAGDNLMFLQGIGHNGSEFPLSQRAFLVAEAAEAWTPTANGTRWRMSTTPNGATTEVERIRIDHDGEVGIGTSTPLARLHVNGTVRVDALGTAGATALCRNASNELATCSSSVRYKQDVQPFEGGLDLLARLRPISFTWKDGGMRDVGFGAEDVAAIDPRLAVFTDGQVEGVKYDRLTTVLVNAVKELEGMVDELRRDRDVLRARVAELESRVRK